MPYETKIHIAGTSDVDAFNEAREVLAETTTPLLAKHHQGHRITRRSILIGATAALICAPAIVRAASLMPIKRVIIPIDPVVTIVPMWAGYVEHLYYYFLEKALRAGWDDKPHGSVFDGISEAQARKSVAYAQAQGWLPKPTEAFHVQA